METIENNRTKNSLLVALAQSALAGDVKKSELICLKILRSTKEDREFSEKFADVMQRYSSGMSQFRSSMLPPADRDLGLSLLKVDENFSTEMPILSEEVKSTVKQFLDEQSKKDVLLKNGLLPTQKILLTGKPGTGKTMLAKWIAQQLRIPIATLDLAASISSYLGKTGENLRRVLDFARNNSCVLLLDEFDAIAKRRDDDSEVGELKRIVNVLLKELEEWNLNSIIIAATNHPQLLDPAINRRFDLTIEMPLPSVETIRSIYKNEFSNFYSDSIENLSYPISRALVGYNCADVTSLFRAALRHHLLENDPLSKCIFLEYSRRSPKPLKQVYSALFKDMHNYMTIRDIAFVTGKAPSTIQHHINK